MLIWVYITKLEDIVNLSNKNGRQCYVRVNKTHMHTWKKKREKKKNTRRDIKGYSTRGGWQGRGGGGGGGGGGIQKLMLSSLH